MRSIVSLTLAVILAVGCSKKHEPDPTATSSPAAAAPGPASAPTVAPQETIDEARSRLLKQLTSTGDRRLDAVEELSVWAETDPATVDALIALLKDKTTAGSGKTHPMRITSTREAAARALSLAGPKGEAALKEKGFAALREGLNDPQPAVREHTAYTIGLLGPVARPLSADVMTLCTHPDSNVRGRAFDALRSIGVVDVAGFVRLLNHENTAIAELAAELVSGLPDVPDAAVPPLIDALKARTNPFASPPPRAWPSPAPGPRPPARRWRRRSKEVTRPSTIPKLSRFWVRKWPTGGRSRKWVGGL
jgi:HEAT repeat protein